MRGLVIFGLIACVVSAARAQDQERSLVDRLLKPNTTLANSDQNKQFRAAGGSIDKRATTTTFYVENKSKPQKFADMRDFRSRDFNANTFWDGKHRNGATDKKIDSESSYSQASLAHPVQAAYDHDRSARSREFADQRAFRDRGKSQKSLNRQNPPMTIEQVRELLNKNK